MECKLVDDKSPSQPIRYGVGEYSGKFLLSAQEQQFQDDIRSKQD